MDKDNKNTKEIIDKAVALSYDPTDIAPRIIAKGQGIIAENLIKKAIANDITIYKNENLLDSLIGLEIDNLIPQDLYEAVAEILFYIYNLDLKRGKNNVK